MFQCTLLARCRRLFTVVTDVVVRFQCNLCRTLEFAGRRLSGIDLNFTDVNPGASSVKLNYNIFPYFPTH